MIKSTFLEPQAGHFLGFVLVSNLGVFSSLASGSNAPG